MYIKSLCNGKLSNCARRRVLTNTDWYTIDGAALSGSTVTIPNLRIQVNFDSAMTCGYWLMSQCPTLVPPFLWHILPNILAEKNFTSWSKLFKSNGKIRSLWKGSHPSEHNQNRGPHHSCSASWLTMSTEFQQIICLQLFPMVGCIRERLSKVD